MEQAGMELNLHGGWASMRLGLHGDQAYVGEGPAWGLGLHRGGDLCGGRCALGWACMGERHAGAQVYVEMGLHGGGACIQVDLHGVHVGAPALYRAHICLGEGPYMGNRSMWGQACMGDGPCMEHMPCIGHMSVWGKGPAWGWALRRDRPAWGGPCIGVRALHGAQACMEEGCIGVGPHCTGGTAASQHRRGRHRDELASHRRHHARPLLPHLPGTPSPTHPATHVTGVPAADTIRYAAPPSRSSPSHSTS